MGYLSKHPGFSTFSSEKLTKALAFLNTSAFWNTDSYNLRYLLSACFSGLEPHNNGRTRMKRTIKKLWTDESGATAIEYGLIAAGISLAIIAAVNGLGTSLNTKFADINTSLK
jgi:pilus assembly protein Flp/PilA